MSEKEREDEVLVEKLDPSLTKFQEEFYRIPNTVVYVLAALINSTVVHTFTPINIQVQKLYKVSPFLVTFNALVFPIGHPLFALISNYILDTRGIQVGCTIGSLLTIAGVILRAFISQSFVLVVIGSCLCSLGNIFVLNSPAKLASNWWNANHLTVVNNICTLANLLSNTIGAVIPVFFVHKDSTTDDVQNLLRFQAYLVGSVLILLIIMIRDKPKNPPSPASAAQIKEPYFKILKSLFTNRNFLTLLASISLGFGVLVAFFATIQFYIRQFSFQNPSAVVSLLLVSATVIGIVGSMVMSAVLRRRKKFKLLLGICYFGAAVQMFMIYLSLESRVPLMIYITGGFAGFFLLPTVPLTLQVGVEITFPIKEATTAGLLLAGGQVFGFVMGFPLIALFDNVRDSSLIATGVYVLLLILAGVSIVMTRIDLKRDEFNKKYNQIENE